MTLSKSSILSQKYSRETLIQARAALDTLVPSCGMPIYTSIDLRDSGDRIVAVDVNLFPAGFNNLNAEALRKASEEMKTFLKKKMKSAGPWKLGLLPESHTNNEGYLKNILALKQVIQNAGAELKVAWTGLPIPKPWELKVGEDKLLYSPIQEVTAWADALVLNHDLSGGPLDPVTNFTKSVFPSPDLGWYKRKKSEHFEIATKILNLVSTKVAIDPNDFLAESLTVGDLNFSAKEDVQRLIDEAAQFFEKLKKRSDKPFVYIKNDSGTYGLGIWNFASLEELKGAAKHLQKKFQRAKQGTYVKQVILQEGIRTRFAETGPEAVVLEPVVYSVNGQRVGGFLRCAFAENDDKGTELNLNRPNAWFEDETRISAELAEVRDLYCFVTQLHSVAAAIEDCPCEANF
ncbi:MAG: glutamate--cysteine ligase [Bdellovibrionota bacterium]